MPSTDHVGNFIPPTSVLKGEESHSQAEDRLSNSFSVTMTDI